MGHPAVNNATPFALESLFVADEEGRPLLVPVVKATYVIHPREGLALAEKPVPVNAAGQFWGDPDTSSYKYEPEVAFIKPATDVVLIGHAHAPKKGTTEVNVTLRVGPLEKAVRVVGDRLWTKAFLGAAPTDPQAFERVPLTWERAFGGWDRSHPDPAKHTFEPRNPVGTGLRQKHGNLEHGIPLPNLEDPRHPLRAYGDTPPPAGFGFTGPSWQPRAAFAGTYDEAWMKDRMPLLPRDFDRRFFNAAAPGLIAPGHLKGDEAVAVENASPGGRLYFQLPGVPAPQCLVTLAGRPDEHLHTQLDTVIVNTDEKLLFLIWRTHLVVRNGPHDVRSIKVWVEGLSAPDRSVQP
ncbi:MAG: DUF2169 domain-containing protein [Gemmataceae bacterium]|nr:DUF2169 domain-containing protein [Gemmataceae bacterium]